MQLLLAVLACWAASTAGLVGLPSRPSALLSSSSSSSSSSAAGLSSPSSSRRSMQLSAGFGKVVSTPEAQLIPDASSDCLCKSGKAYGDCCSPYHAGKAFAPTVTAMVRSRFCALRLKLVPYLMETTHPDHKEYADPEEQQSKRKQWTRGLKEFCNEYEFVDLIFDDEARDGTAANLASASEGAKAQVSFVAKLQKAGLGERTPENLVETSDFLLTGGRWLYRDAKVNNPFKNIQGENAPNKPKFITTAKRGVPRGN